MGETRGYLTIADRTDGWGDGYGAGGEGAPGYVDPDLQPEADAENEDTADRADRILKTRKSFVETVDATIADRTQGRGGEYDGTAGADDGYRTGGVEDTWDAEDFDLADPADYFNGIFNDEDDVAETGTGSNANPNESADTDFLATGRTSTALPTSAVAAHRSELPVVGTDYTISSIIDRTSNWGHTAGSQSDRKD